MSLEEKQAIILKLGLSEEVEKATNKAISEIELLRGVKFRLEPKTLDSSLQVFVTINGREVQAGYFLCYTNYIEFCTNDVRPTYFLTISSQGFSLEYENGDPKPERLPQANGLQRIFNEMVDRAQSIS